MKSNKYFFRDHKKTIKEDVDKYEAHQESQDVELRKCNHHDITITDNEIRCKCGAAWTGTGLSKLEKLLKQA